MKSQWVGSDGTQVDMLYLFQIAIDENGDYLALRDESPMFCLQGNSIADVASKAERAFEAYKRMSKK